MNDLPVCRVTVVTRVTPNNGRHCTHHTTHVRTLHSYCKRKRAPFMHGRAPMRSRHYVWKIFHETFTEQAKLGLVVSHHYLQNIIHCAVIYMRIIVGRCESNVTFPICREIFCVHLRAH